jgi:tetratricopeptide (TPR) repeat protein
MSEFERLDGWKEIARHMNRDRSTVIRWRRSGLPVYNVPGSRTGSVYAYANELDSWLAKSGSDGHEIAFAPATPAPEPVSVTVGNSRTRGPNRYLIAGLCISIIVVAAIGFWRLSAKDSPPSPNLDPTSTRLFVQARVDWAKRTPDSLRKAIEELDVVIRRQPEFADAYGAIADAYLLTFEFGSMAKPAAFTNAETAARAALAIDPDNSSATRAMGFIAYWWHHDNKSARQYFLRAIGHDPDDAQTHHWYGNALINNRETAAGLAQLDDARRLDPESPAIEIDYALAEWETGQEAQAIAMLEGVAARAPTLSGPPGYLAYMFFAHGDWARYLAFASKEVELRGDPLMIEQITAQSAAFARSGASGLFDAISFLPATARETYFPGGLTMPAAAAALGGRRDRLLEILSLADARGEVWLSSSWPSQLLEHWRNDPRIAAKLKRLFDPGTTRGQLAP